MRAVLGEEDLAAVGEQPVADDVARTEARAVLLAALGVDVAAAVVSVVWMGK